MEWKLCLKSGHSLTACALLSNSIALNLKSDNVGKWRKKNEAFNTLLINIYEYIYQNPLICERGFSPSSAANVFHPIVFVFLPAPRFFWFSLWALISLISICRTQMFAANWKLLYYIHSVPGTTL